MEQIILPPEDLTNEGIAARLTNDAAAKRVRRRSSYEANFSNKVVKSYWQFVFG